MRNQHFAYTHITKEVKEAMVEKFKQFFIRKTEMKKKQKSSAYSIRSFLDSIAETYEISHYDDLQNGNF